MSREHGYAALHIGTYNIGKCALFSSINWLRIELQGNSKNGKNGVMKSRLCRALVIWTVTVSIIFDLHRSIAAEHEKPSFDIATIERPRIMEKAVKYLREEPVTVTASHCDR